jgi:hypothetical protein
MGLIRAALGLKQSDEEWRRLEDRYGGVETPDSEVEQDSDRKRSWGQYQKSRDQR